MTDDERQICLDVIHNVSTTPLTFSLIVSILSNPSLSTTLTTTVQTPALNVCMLASSAKAG
ncbi:MAG: hypothetical protein LBI05_01250 [Planctomycetaceae bacterium]|nr:hypothetical protein [Planctomycetaceae bacterium]